MTAPPEYGPHRTETQILGDDIATAMRNLRRDWPHMLRPGETQPPGWAMKNGAPQGSREGVLDDLGRVKFPQDQSPEVGQKGDATDADMRRIDKVVSFRVHVTQMLNSWSRLVVEDRDIENPMVRCRHGIDVRWTLKFPRLGPLAAPVVACREGIPLQGDLHKLSGTDVLDMSSFIEVHAEWMSGHEAAQEARDELVELAHRCHLIAYPPRRESMSIGTCPLLNEDNAQCGGDVRVRLTGEDRDGEAYAACNRCGEVAVASWWESHMFDDPETRRWLTDADVVTLMHRLYGEVIAQATVRQWVKRRVLEPSALTNHDGRRLFDRDAVVYAIDLHKRRQAVRG